MKNLNGIMLIKKMVMFITIISLAGCIGDQQVAKRGGLIKDFSTDTSSNGCGATFLHYASPYNVCEVTCSEGYHAATTTELSDVKKQLVADAEFTYDNIPTATILKRVNNSANICVEDVYVEVRPTNDISIKNDFCSCINGKSDLISDCDAICATKPVNDTPTLYVNTIIGPEITLNTKLGNLHNWCSVELSNDDTQPQCALVAFDGTTTYNLPMNTNPNSNSFSANISTLAKNRTWILKAVETATGSKAQSKEFQIRRKDQTEDTPVNGALKIAPISQYTCLSYGGQVDNVGNIIRTTFTRIFYYFTANERPAPMAATSGGNARTIVCHDEIKNPGNDSSTYDRLELVPGLFTMWDKTDTRFVAKAVNGNKLTINKMIEDRLVNEYNQTGVSIGLFNQISYPNRPTTSGSDGTAIPLGFIMIPFSDPTSGKAYCPTTSHYTGNQPLFKILGDYLPDTEGLYLGEKDPEIISDGTTPKTIYGTMFVTESILLKYGFYIENSVKIKISAPTMHTKTIHYYWPINESSDPLIQGTRKLYTVRAPDGLNGSSPTGIDTSERATDKRIGCIPKSDIVNL